VRRGWAARFRRIRGGRPSSRHKSDADRHLRRASIRPSLDYLSRWSRLLFQQGYRGLRMIWEDANRFAALHFRIMEWSGRAPALASNEMLAGGTEDKGSTAICHRRHSTTSARRNRPSISARNSFPHRWPGNLAAVPSWLRQKNGSRGPGGGPAGQSAARVRDRHGGPASARHHLQSHAEGTWFHDAAA